MPVCLRGATRGGLGCGRGGLTRVGGWLGGRGGWPDAPGDSGNIAGEEACPMLDAMGYCTGIDLSKLLAVERQLPGIVGHEVPGQVAKAGRITDLHAPPPYVAELKAASA